jgi:hypothetical protein
VEDGTAAGERGVSGCEALTGAGILPVEYLSEEMLKAGETVTHPGSPPAANRPPRSLSL